MRVREPFAGYTLSSGHYIFHIVYLIGSYLPEYEGSLNGEALDAAKDVLFQLRMAHTLVILANVL